MQIAFCLRGYRILEAMKSPFASHSSKSNRSTISIGLSDGHARFSQAFQVLKIVLSPYFVFRVRVSK